MFYNIKARRVIPTKRGTKTPKKMMNKQKLRLNSTAICLFDMLSPSGRLHV